MFSKALASDIRENESYMTINMGTPISYNSSILAEFGMTAGVNNYIYFPTDNYTQYDVEDRTRLSYLTARLKMAQTTLDYSMYPTSGRRRLLEFRYIFSHESHEEGTIFADGTKVTTPLKHTFLARLNMEDYYDLGRWFALGYNFDLTVSTPLNLSDYIIHNDCHACFPAYSPEQDSHAWGIQGSCICRPDGDSGVQVYKNILSAAVRRVFSALPFAGPAGLGKL